ncbi:carnitine O-acetyltransferase-like, partial [Numida meleagris]|uniref:carnitine O-acetyltransferase-like n=1 Tax=Numida meleagris TaxID=8996 RepID=UPI000B3E176D
LISRGGGTSSLWQYIRRDFLFRALKGRDFLCSHLQVIVGADGSCGLLYDPEVLDGAIAAEMADHALAFCRSPAPEPAPGMAVPRPQRLRFCIGPEVGPEVQRARRHLDR